YRRKTACGDAAAERGEAGQHEHQCKTGELDLAPPRPLRVGRDSPRQDERRDDDDPRGVALPPCPPRLREVGPRNGTETKERQRANGGRQDCSQRRESDEL